MSSNVRVPTRKRRLRHALGFMYRSLEVDFEGGASMQLVDPTSKEVLHTTEVVSGTSHPEWTNFPPFSKQGDLTSVIVDILDGQSRRRIQTQQVVFSDMTFIANSLAALSSTKNVERGMYVVCVDGVYQPNQAPDYSSVPLVDSAFGDLFSTLSSTSALGAPWQTIRKSLMEGTLGTTLLATQSLNLNATGTPNTSRAASIRGGDTGRVSPKNPVEAINRASSMRGGVSSFLRVSDVKAHVVRLRQLHYALQGTQLDVDNAKRLISEAASRREKLTAKECKLAELKHRLAALKATGRDAANELERLKVQNKDTLDEIESRQITLQNLRGDLAKHQGTTREAQSTLMTKAALCVSVETASTSQSRLLLRGLKWIYNIEISPIDAKRPIKIVGARAPGPSDYVDDDAAVFYGHIAHVVYLAASILNVHLRHKIVCTGSRSSIIEGDHIETKLPLYVARSADRPKCKLAVIALTQNVQHLLIHIEKAVSPADPLLTQVYQLLS